MTEKLEDRRLTVQLLPEINCCPGGLELAKGTFKGEIDRTLNWRKEMLKLGMTGFVSYHEGLARGFIEYMPAEVAPFPIEAPDGAVLMCYHWEPVDPKDEDEHLLQEKRLIQMVIDEVKGKFSGLATLGWHNPMHFPLTFLKGLGFEEIEASGEIRLMWLPFQQDAPSPKMSPAQLEPQDLSAEGLLAIESAWSSRCPYTVHNGARLAEVIADLPEDVKGRVRHFAHRIDTREEAIQYSISPWNWEWYFFNGEEVPIFNLSSEKIQERITDEVSRLRG